MSELAQTAPQQTDAHAEIAAKIQTAAGELPTHVVSVDESLEGVTRIDSRPNGNGHGIGGNFVQSSQGGEEPNVAIGFTAVDQAAPKNGNMGVYSFRSRAGQGVEDAVARRLIMPHDTVTRAGADNYLEDTPGAKLSAKGVRYEHKFGGAQKDRVGKLVADMVIKQAARTKPRPKI